MTHDTTEVSHSSRPPADVHELPAADPLPRRARAQALANVPERAGANDRLDGPRPPRAGRKKLKPADAPRVFTYLAECPRCQSTRLKSTGRASGGGLYAFCRDCRQIILHYRLPISELEIIQSD